MSSSRLPGKVMKPLAGKPMIWHIYKRAEACKFVDYVIIATSTDISDDPLINYCESENLNYYRGSLDNVLSRFLNILDDKDHQYVVRITGDCPLIHPEFIDNQIMALNTFDGDVIWLEENSSVLEGQGVFSTRSLQYIFKQSTNKEDLEHVGSVYISENPDQFRIVHLSLPEYLVSEDIRITVDEKDDYDLLNEIYSNLWKSSYIDLKEVLHWLKKNPELLEMNKAVHHKKLNIEIKKKRKEWTDLEKAGYFQYQDYSKLLSRKI